MTKAIFAIIFVHFFLYVLWLTLKSKATAEQRIKLLKTLGGFSVLSIVSVLVLSAFVLLF